MKKLHLVAWLNASAFLLFLMLCSTGSIMYFLLPPGSGRRFSVLGFTRHQWGDIHFWISVIFLCVIGIHLYLHRRWIFSVVKGRSSERKNPRLIIGLLAVLFAIVLALVPFIIGVEETVPFRK